MRYVLPFTTRPAQLLQALQPPNAIPELDEARFIVRDFPCLFFSTRSALLLFVCFVS